MDLKYEEINEDEVSFANQFTEIKKEDIGENNFCIEAEEVEIDEEEVPVEDQFTEIKKGNEDKISEEISSIEMGLTVQTIRNLGASVPSLSNSKRMLEGENDADLFVNPPPREVPAHNSRCKDLGLAQKSLLSVSPMSSTNSSISSNDFEEDWLGIINEELKRRAEFRQRMNGKMLNIKKKIKKTGDLISRIKGEKKSLRVHRETLREQIRLLDEQELSLDRRERSAKEARRKYEAIAAKFIEINN